MNLLSQFLTHPIFLGTLAGSLVLMVILILLGILSHQRRRVKPAKIVLSDHNEKSTIDVKPLEPIVTNAAQQKSEPRLVYSRYSAPDKTLIETNEFDRLVAEIKKQQAALLHDYVPYFTWSENQITRFSKPHESHTLLERLFTFWQGGFKAKDHTLLLGCYVASSQQDTWMRFLLQVSAYRKAPTDQKQWFQFLFQDTLQLVILPEQLQPSGVDVLDFCLKLAKNEKITRQEYRTQDASRSIPNTNFTDFVQTRATLPLQVMLWHEKEVLSEISQLLFQQFVKSGKVHYSELWLYGQINPKIKQPTHPDDVNSLCHELLRYSAEGKLLASLVTRLSPDTTLLDALEPDESDVKHWQSVQSSLPEPLRREAFLLLSKAGFHSAAGEFFPRLNQFAREPAVRLYQARNLYYLNDYTQAHEQVEALLNDCPTSLAILNEAAIYNFRLGHFERTEALYNQMKELFPDNPTVKYNEAIYFEQKTLGEIKERWEQVDFEPETANNANTALSK